MPRFLYNWPRQEDNTQFLEKMQITCYDIMLIGWISTWYTGYVMTPIHNCKTSQPTRGQPWDPIKPYKRALIHAVILLGIFKLGERHPLLVSGWATLPPLPSSLQIPIFIRTPENADNTHKSVHTLLLSFFQ